MNKDSFIRIYLWLSMVFVLVLAYLQNSFTASFMGESYPDIPISGNINASIFKYFFETYGSGTESLNVPLILFIAFAVLTVFVAIFALKEKPVQQKLIQEVVIYNVIISLLLIVSSIVMMILLPGTVAGIIDYGLIVMKFPIQGGDIVNVFNFTYIFIVVYVILNIVVLQITKEKKYREKKSEENVDSEFLL